MELILEDEQIRKRQREEARERKREIKRRLRQQELKIQVGGHDKTGTRVTEDTPLPKAPTQNKPNLSDNKDSFHKKCPIVKNEGKIIGKGANGTVFIGLNTSSGELVAIKEVIFMKNEENKKETDLRDQVTAAIKEINLMKKLLHPNIVRYYGAERTSNVLQIIMEYVPGGSLRSILNHFGRLDDRLVACYARQMLLGLIYLHSQSVAHLDIKSDNALLGVTGEVKLADFGAAEMLENCQSGKAVGTPAFMAPEIIHGMFLYSYITI